MEVSGKVNGVAALWIGPKLCKGSIWVAGLIKGLMCCQESEKNLSEDEIVLQRKEISYSESLPCCCFHSKIGLFFLELKQVALQIFK